MTTTFSGVTLPNASKFNSSTVVAIRDALLLSGKHRILTNTNVGFEPKYRCFGTWAEYLAVAALVGSSATLVTTQVPGGYTNCYISSLDGPEESDNPDKFYFTVSFKRDTVS
jgi:hypothetical protein